MKNREMFVYEMQRALRWYRTGDALHVELESGALGEAFDALMDEVRENGVPAFDASDDTVEAKPRAWADIEPTDYRGVPIIADDTETETDGDTHLQTDWVDNPSEAPSEDKLFAARAQRDRAVAEAESVRELNSQMCANWHEDKERFNDTLNILRDEIEGLQDRVTVAESMRDLAEATSNKRFKQFNKLDRDFRGFLHHLAATPMEDSLSGRRLVAKFEVYREDNPNG